MKRVVIAGCLTLGIAAVAGTGWVREARAREHAALSEARSASEGELRNRTADLAFFEARARRDPFSAIDRARAASLYLQRSRETGDFDDVLRAESSARRSLQLRPEHNSAARVALIGSLVSQHRFLEARREATLLVLDAPEHPSYRATRAEVEMELGDYRAAAATFDSLVAYRTSLAVAPRLARWEEMQGHLPDARRLLAYAQREAERRHDLSREQRAWYPVRRGDLELRAGSSGAAARAFREALSIHPDDHRALAGLARAAYRRGRWEEGIALGERSTAQVLDPLVLAEMSEAAEAAGDSARSERFARVAAVAASRGGSAVHRAWSLFRLDRGEAADAILRAARVDVEGRPDVNGLDLLSWALYKQGRLDEALRAAASARALGTQDPVLLFHGGMILRASGHPDSARLLLGRALQIDPAFHPLHAATARAVLDSAESRR